MEKNRLRIIKLIDSNYRMKGAVEQDDSLYCEIQYKRDRSSFAGIAFRITDNKDVIIVESCEERLIRNINNYEKLYMGCIQEYISAVKNTFSLGRKEYGIEILFLIYSDVRSSQIIFEELMKIIDTNIEKIKSQY